MSLKSLGAAGLVLAVVLFLLAAAQPATVAESSTACVDSAYYQDCSTVEYERANPQRAQLFVVAGIALVASLTTYGVGAARSSGDGSGGSSSSKPRPASVESGGTDTLREQLAARQSEQEGDEASSDATRTEAENAQPTPPADTATVGTESEPNGRTDADAESGWSDNLLTSSTVGVVGSALASAFLLSWLLGSVTYVDSALAQTLLFALFAVPGVYLYARYVDGADGGRAPGVSD
ncbi:MULTISPECIES: hypothetical protein [Halobacterium]|uniref:hypothetical protein n=1 Tax=Halobacterium TaxID=2239 RepID=UPI00073F887B|nr:MULTISPECIES: hypothetical protein [Halobacterium]MCG1002598.1 hypothetical protein [Halobacterium noricense]